ncbi:hypothetical protein ACFOUP_18185 [Belliella kenyensis]|uniref:DUF4199 domain-containing protein n=1 Tax=Belliella kenyensis TaxID=1472724 RepID=A0ABV8ERV7_9BACT|nr:hypothetical protein [Belliella kenyensis]MCH7402288.1 hypothetical protein [Belliella kenyensis]MDN3601805.1 hypothetical protein [Belliella kenyensis]
MKNISKIRSVIEISVLITVISLTLCYIVAYNVDFSPENLMVVAFYSFLSPVVYFLIILFTINYMLPKEMIELFEADEKPIKWYIHFIGFFFGIYISSLILDNIYFYLIDNSISKEYAKVLQYFVKDDSEKINSFVIFSKLSPFTQGYIVNFISILIACLISIPIAHNTFSKRNIDEI